MRFFTADLHLGHANIIGYCERPWDSVEAMNEGLIERWNATVSPTDEVIILGDLAMGKIDQTLRLIPRLHGTKRLIPGNHDRCFKGYRDMEYAREWALGYEQVGLAVLSYGALASFNLGGRTVNACHFPYETDDRHADKYRQYHPHDTGTWLLHGHVHDAWLRRGHQLNVGVDVWDYAPVAEDWLIDIMTAAEGT